LTTCCRVLGVPDLGINVDNVFVTIVASVIVPISISITVTVTAAITTTASTSARLNRNRLARLIR
jgi:hypothetical protein